MYLYLIGKQVQNLCCPAAVMWSLSYNVTGKPGRQGRRWSRARRTAWYRAFKTTCDVQDCAFLGISASCCHRTARRFYFDCNVCMKYICYSYILTSDKRNKDSLVRCFYENKFFPSMLKYYERKEKLHSKISIISSSILT